MMFPGQFIKMPPFQLLPGPQAAYAGKLIILVNEVTQSAAEQLAMALRTHTQARIIGSQTAGSIGDVAEFYLPGGILTRISALGVYYPDGGQTQRVGVRIDETVTPTIAGLRQGRDEVLERALFLLN